jgi:hypothetical protein
VRGIFSPDCYFGNRQKKTAITGGFLEIRFLLLRTLTAFHRRWAGIAKVKVEKVSGKRHVCCHG